MMTMETARPVSETARLHAVDVVRGTAILGILLVNMGLFFSPIYLEFLGGTWFEGGLDRVVNLGILAFARGKFYTIFSILFGFGLAIQYERFSARGMSFGRFWARRMSVLLAMGLLHGLVLWFGDILAWYALAGFALFFFRKTGPRALKIWAVVLLAVPLLIATAMTLLIALAGMLPEIAAEVALAFEEQARVFETALSQAGDRYPVAGFAETVRLNVAQWTQLASSVLFMLPNLVGMFVIGLLFARCRVFHDTAAHLPKLRAALLWLIPVAIAANGTSVLLYGRFSMVIPSGTSLLFSIVGTIGQLAGCLTYIFLLLIAFHSRRAHAWLAPIGAVGRMALTNYIVHTIVFTTLANGYGAGLYGRIPPSVGLLMTLTMFAIQIAASNAWLRVFRFGPLEWLWRSLTYGAIQPLRRGI